MKLSAVFVPSRSRPLRFEQAVKQLKLVTKVSEIIALIDEDEYIDYPILPNITYEINPKPQTLGVNEKLNTMAYKYRNDFEYLLWIADDIHVVTKNWDEILINAIKSTPFGISYPDDSLQGKKLPSNGTCFDSDIVKTLGFLAPPVLSHLFIDDFWKLLGDSLNTLKYCPEVKLIHNHAVINPLFDDDQYRALNSPEAFERERKTFEFYAGHQFGYDLSKLQKLIRL